MSFLDSGGTGPPVVFLHGNPTSSHLWRDVMPRIEGRRLIAVDLVGMGRSGKPDIGYTLPEHIAHVEDVILGFGDDMVIVAHDWGVAIGMDLLRRHPEKIIGIAFMEGHLRPLAGWKDFDDGGRDLFRQLRAPGTGERLVLEENFFVETLLPAAVLSPLAPSDLAEYRRPYPSPASRRPLLRWAREIPVGGDPPHSAAILADGWAHLCSSRAPKLLLRGRPGAIVTDAVVARCRAALPNLTVADVGAAGHFVPEDRPAEVAAALDGWLTASTTR